MNVYIPTMGRLTKQVTLNNLPPGLQAQVTLVVTEEEYEAHCRMYGARVKDVVAPNVQGIGEVRQWCCYEPSEDHKVMMLDDDLTFFTRRMDEPTKFINATDDNMRNWWLSIKANLGSYAHASLAPREGANRCTDALRYNMRMLRVLAYRTDVMEKNGVKFDRLPVMEDFDVSLQLLRLGYPSLTINNWVQNQGGSNTSGGCSTYRTLEVQAQGAEGLKRLHPEFVTVVEKTTKTAWNGATRKDVRVQWKKAYLSSDGVGIL